MKDTTGRIEQLAQIGDGPVWDGNLICKTAAADLEKHGYIYRVCGWSILTQKGLRTLVELGFLRP